MNKSPIVALIWCLIFAWMAKLTITVFVMLFVLNDGGIAVDSLFVLDGFVLVITSAASAYYLKELFMRVIKILR